jgi:hypothetical protein
MHGATIEIILILFTFQSTGDTFNDLYSSPVSGRIAVCEGTVG